MAIPELSRTNEQFEPPVEETSGVYNYDEDQVKHFTQALSFLDGSAENAEKANTLMAQAKTLPTRVDRDSMKREANEFKKKASAERFTAMMQFAAFKGVSLEASWGEGTEVIRTVVGDDKAGTQTTRFFNQFEQLTQERAEMLKDPDEFVIPDYWPKLKRESETNSLDGRRIINPDTSAILDHSTLKASEYLLVGLQLTSVYNSKARGPEHLRPKVSTAGTTSTARKQEIFGRIQEKLTIEADLFDQLTLAELIDTRDFVLLAAGRNLGGLRRAGLIPSIITADSRQEFVEQVKKELSKPKIHKNERAIDIKAIKELIQSNRGEIKVQAKRQQAAIHAGQLSLN